jgi:hypothetical protein
MRIFKELGLSGAEAAQAIGVTRQQLYNVITAEARCPGTAARALIAATQRSKDVNKGLLIVIHAALVAGADIDGAGDSVTCHEHSLSLTRAQCHRGPGLNSESRGRNGDREALLRG